MNQTALQRLRRQRVREIEQAALWLTIAVLNTVGWAALALILRRWLA